MERVTLDERVATPSHTVSRAAPRLLPPPGVQGIERAAAPRALYVARPPLGKRARRRAWRRRAWPYPPPRPTPRATRAHVGVPGPSGRRVARWESC